MNTHREPRCPQPGISAATQAVLSCALAIALGCALAALLFYGWAGAFRA